MTLIETHQYILAQFYNEIGIAGNWNMKRERVNTAETELMTGSLDVNIKLIEEEIKKGIDKVNQLFGTSITFEIDPEVITSTEEELASIEESIPANNSTEESSTEEEEPPKDGTVVEEEEVKKEVKKEDKKEGDDE